jgi:hypothetical protein
MDWGHNRESIFADDVTRTVRPSWVCSAAKKLVFGFSPAAC